MLHFIADRLCLRIRSLQTRIFWNASEENELETTTIKQQVVTVELYFQGQWFGSKPHDHMLDLSFHVAVLLNVYDCFFMFSFLLSCLKNVVCNMFYDEPDETTSPNNKGTLSTTIKPNVWAVTQFLCFVLFPTSVFVLIFFDMFYYIVKNNHSHFIRLLLANKSNVCKEQVFTVWIFFL